MRYARYGKASQTCVLAGFRSPATPPGCCTLRRLPCARYVLAAYADVGI